MARCIAVPVWCRIGAHLGGVVMSASSISVSELGFGIGEHHDALRGLSIDVNAGERVAVLGQTVRAKPPSSCISMVSWPFNLARCGLVIPHCRIEFDGNSSPGGAVFQDADDQLFMSSVREDVAFGRNLGISGAELDELVERTLGARLGAAAIRIETPII